MCGGTAADVANPTILNGLSPRVRGNRPVTPTSTMRSRSIPACAGEPPALSGINYSSTVYPRVCGGTRNPEYGIPHIVGLSPRVRGNLSATPYAYPVAGSIPACAGEPGARLRYASQAGVYPRVCGGTSTSCCLPARKYGLSPRVRGNRGAEGDRRHQQRSIPACAGEPIEGAEQYNIDEVYPRVCGGTRQHGYLRQMRVGLSPRVRGNLGRKTRARGRRRSIPACAGEPRRATRSLRSK